MADVCEASSTIDSTLFDKYEVKRGLRDLNGQGVLTGLTEVSEIRSYTVVDHEMVPCEGKLFYQGIDIEEIVGGFLQEKRFGYEEVVFPQRASSKTLKMCLQNTVKVFLPVL